MPNPTDTIEVDLTPQNFQVTLSQPPVFEIDITPYVYSLQFDAAGMGPPGPAGPQGTPGAPGTPGTAGPPGSAGPPGAAATVDVGSTVTGAPGTQASVNNSGSSAAAIFNFAIPAGVQGVQGPTGPQGATGPQGQGFNWRGVWSASTAYAIGDAVQRSSSSYTCTQANTGQDPASAITYWDLIAAQGAPGPQGPQGATGAQGPQGNPGSTGATGSQGPQGNPGATGATGPAGPTGPQGATGATGPQGPAGTTGVSANANNKATLGTDSLFLVQGTAAGVAATTHAQVVSGDDPQLTTLASSSTKGLLKQLSGNTTDFVDGTNNCQNLVAAVQPTIWSARLRTFQALGNRSFEVDQRNVGAALTNPANTTFIQDRWQVLKSALTGTVNTALQDASTAPIVIPGTLFGLTSKFQRFTVGTAQASLAAGDYYFLQQAVEGPRWRELSSDNHSISLLVRSSVAGLKFSVALLDNTLAHTLAQQCTISSSATWTMITLPSLPVWSGSFSAAPGQVGYFLRIVLAAGTTFSAAPSNVWQAGNIFGVTGNSNFLATAGATFDIAYAGHEPGALCTTPQDLSFGQNLDGDFGCLRYYQKSYDYATALGATGLVGARAMISPSSTFAWGPLSFPKIMAKDPTATFYNHSTGAINSVQDTGGVNHACSSATVGTTGFSNISFTTATTALMGVYFHYTADTGL